MILTVLGGYLALGIIVLVLLDLFTGRISKNIKNASYQAQEKLASSGSFVGVKTAVAITILAMWVFWPLVIFAAIRG